MKHAPNPRIVDLMKTSDRLRLALETLEAAGHAAHLVGGSVRDALMGRPVNDFDISTSARPDTVQTIFEALGHAVHPTGIEHGTLTVLIDGEAFEITTWRRDVETDGRRAVIAFADRLEEDAQRRDFTFNALYAARDGSIIDPTEQGVADAAARRIRFVGDAETRIREDALRILRYFRFAAQLEADIGTAPELVTIAGLKDLVSSVSRERVGAEMLKLLGGAAPCGPLVAMARVRVLDLALPEIMIASSAIRRRITCVLDEERHLGLQPDAFRRLGALVSDVPRDSLRLSRASAKSLEQLLQAVHRKACAGELGYHYGRAMGEDALVLRVALKRGHPVTSVDLADLDRGAALRFPVKAESLMGQFEGAALGAELKRRERIWLSGQFPAA